MCGSYHNVTNDLIVMNTKLSRFSKSSQAGRHGKGV